MTRLIIAGSRTIVDPQRLTAAIAVGYQQQLYSQITEVVSGMAHGVDTLAVDFAQQKGIPVAPFPPQYDRYGRGAPLRRNEAMADYGEVLVALWDGHSRGTQHMIGCMRKRGKPVLIVTAEGWST